jgi:Flp pilus assembly protein TadG
MSVRLRDEAGSAAVEMTLLLPVALAVLFFLVLAGRLSTAHHDVLSASRDAARAASLADTPDGASDAAHRAAAATLAGRSITCEPLHVEVDTSRLVPGGQVAATVTCSVHLDDVALPGIPGSRAVSARAVEVVDRFRGLG